MTDDSLKAARDRLLASVDFDTEAAAHLIDAIAELVTRIRQGKTAEGHVWISGALNERGRFVLGTPEISQPERFHRRRA